MMKKFLALFVFLLLPFASVHKGTVFGENMIEILEKYKNDDNTRQLLVIVTNEQSKEELENQSKWDDNKSLAVAYFYVKDLDDKWCEVFENQKCYIGINGPGKEEEGDGKTPLGTFSVLESFGIKENPGTRMTFIPVKDSTYACDEKCEYYNMIIDAKEVKHDCKGEHMIVYKPHYNYGLTTSYNKERNYTKGSNIFIHCFGSNLYTGGCIALSEKNVVSVIKSAVPNQAKITIV